MIDGLIHWSLDNRWMVTAAGMVILIWGGVTAARMPIDVFPDLTAPTVTIITEGHGMAPTEMESLVTFPIEAALNGAPGVRRVRSATSAGIGVVWVEFDWGEDIYRARQLVTEKLSLVTDQFPSQVEQPVLAPISSIMGEILFIALTSDRHDGLELRTVADTILRRRLLSIRGVSQVAPIGGGVKQYQVMVSTEKLLAHSVSLQQVEEALGSANENTSAGFMVEGGQEFLIQGMGRIRGLEDIENVVVAYRQETPILIGQLGRAALGEALKRGDGSYNGAPAVILGIQKQPDANTLELTRLLDEEIDRVQSTLPEGMTIHKDIFRQADFIDVAVRNVERALAEGGVMVALVMIVFLANLRASIITLTAIPLSLLFAVLALRALGATINTMTLGGMVIAVGALVDDAAIDVENVLRRLRENARRSPDERKRSLHVVYEASLEVRASIVFATLIIMLVFIPLFFLAGVEGRLLWPLGTAYLTALAASLVISLTLTPVLCSFLLPESRGVKVEGEGRLVQWIKLPYAKYLPWALDRWRSVLVASALLLVVALVSTPFLGRSFLPPFNEGTLTISAVTMPGTSLEKSSSLGTRIEEILLSFPEVRATARRTGRAELDEHVQGVESAEIDATLHMLDRSKEELLEEMRRAFALVPGTNINIGQPISHRIDHMLSGTRANIAVKIFGDDISTLRTLARNAEEIMGEIAGVVDLSVEPQVEIPMVQVSFDRTALARYGIAVDRAAATVEAAKVGRVVGQVLEGPYAFDLVVRFEGGWADDIEALRRLPVDTPGGARVPLGTVATVRKDFGPNLLARENAQRRIVVSCNVAGRDLVSTVEEISERIAASIALPRGYWVEYGGQFQSEAEAREVLLSVGALVVAGILAILIMVFRSSRDAFIIMLNLPLALIGGVAGVFLSGGVLSVASIIGFITLFGIATRNGILLISHIRHLVEEEGVTDFREAVIRGAMERISPILMTALSAALALIPLALRAGRPGSEIQAPMAVVILYGLLTSTALNLMVVPSAYWRWGRLSGSSRNGPISDS